MKNATSKYFGYQMPVFIWRARPRIIWNWIVAGLGLLVTGCCSTHTPLSLQPPAGQKLMLHVYAKGVQIYRCEHSPGDPEKLVWKLKGPEAMLFDESGSVVGSHYAEQSLPVWELDKDTSKVVGEVSCRADAPSGHAIPWLLLRAKTTTGLGLFGNVTYIQRVNTIGGLPPDLSTGQMGQEVRSHYTAEYIFYCSKGGHLLCRR